MSPNFYNKPYDRLSVEELYDLLALRQEVFIVEQNCPYLDADRKDQVSEHILLYNDEGSKLVAYARTVPKGVSYEQHCSIGRVITRPELRGTGTGKKLMQYAIQLCHKLYPGEAIKLSAQVYALGFYESLGFEALGEEYLEDDIPHVGMVLD